MNDPSNRLSFQGHLSQSYRVLIISQQLLVNLGPSKKNKPRLEGASGQKARLTPWAPSHDQEANSGSQLGKH